jgi:protein-tyrosine phosphatase
VSVFDAEPVDPRPGDRTARLHVVCTGNICRSPLAMAMLDREARRRLGPDAPVEVTSSGLHGLTGRPAEADSRRLAVDRDAPLDGHVASVTEPERVRTEDLVLTMTEAHRAAVVRHAPSASRHTFTLLELARLCAALVPLEEPDEPRARVRTVARLAHAARAHVARPAGPEDIDDPYGRASHVYDRMAAELDEAIAAIAPQLFGWLPGERPDVAGGAHGAGRAEH